jgi:ferredoxin-NADP reductase
MRALLEDSPFAPGETTLLYRYTRTEHAVFADELTAIAARRGVELHFLPGPRRAGGSWLPTDPQRGTDDAETLKLLVPDITDCDIYACGPPDWLRSVRRSVHRAGARRDQLHTEEFAW